MGAGAAAARRLRGLVAFTARAVARSTGMHVLGRAFPWALLLVIGAALPLSWAWRNFVTPSNWWTSEWPGSIGLGGRSIDC